MRAFDLGECHNPVAALKEAIMTEGPYLIRVPIKRNEEVYPMVPPGASNREMIGGESYAGN